MTTDVGALMEELEGYLDDDDASEWLAQVDAESGQPYWFNASTGELAMECPPSLRRRPQAQPDAPLPDAPPAHCVRARRTVSHRHPRHCGG